MGAPLIAAIERRLRQANYDVALNVALSMPLNGRPLQIRPAIVASTFYFSWGAFSYVSQNIFVWEVKDARNLDLDILFAVGAHYSKTVKSPFSYLTAAGKAWSAVPAPVNLARVKALGNYIVIPVLITGSPHKDLIAYATGKQRQRGRLFHLSALIDSDTGAIYYQRSGGIWGFAVLREMRSVISQLIAPKPNCVKRT
jgi:hypothetical protein